LRPKLLESSQKLQNSNKRNLIKSCSLQDFLAAAFRILILTNPSAPFGKRDQLLVSPHSISYTFQVSIKKIAFVLGRNKLEP